MKSTAYSNTLCPPDLSARPLGHTVERDFPFDPETLYQAWTIHFDQWFAAPGAILMKAAVNAPYFFEVQFEGKRHPHYGRFLRLEPNRLVEITWVTGEGGTKGAETVLTIELSPRGAGTHLRLTHAGWPDEDSRAKNEAAWPSVLDHLARQLSIMAPNNALAPNLVRGIS
jgi:uncharacterized protein YndB with AHSA1/START domain